MPCCVTTGAQSEERANQEPSDRLQKGKIESQFSCLSVERDKLLKMAEVNANAASVTEAALLFTSTAWSAKDGGIISVIGSQWNLV